MENKKSWAVKLGLFVTIISLVGGIIGILSSLKTFKSFPELQGTWEVTFKVQESTYSAYINDVYVYRIYVTQTENFISGSGEQKLYNGNYAKKHFKFEWAKTDIQDIINISYVLHGTRETFGMMDLKIDPDDNRHLLGTFSGAAANTKGTVDVTIK